MPFDGIRTKLSLIKMNDFCLLKLVYANFSVWVLKYMLSLQVSSLGFAAHEMFLSFFCNGTTKLYVPSQGMFIHTILLSSRKSQFMNQWAKF